jgi:predicted O-methyltransferase YrrM
MRLRKRIRDAICGILGRLPFLAHLLAQPLRFYMQRSLHRQYFHVWEGYGFHITPVHYYSPIPDTRSCLSSIWNASSEMPGVDMNDEKQCQMLTSIFPLYEGEFIELFNEDTRTHTAYRSPSPNFSGIDAAVLYSMVRHFRPRAMIEVGGGFSTRISAAAALRNNSTALTCIEPYPDKVLASGFPGLQRLIRQQVQAVDLSLFESLSSADILFIDSSHVAKCGSDVVYLCLEVLPRLKPGVIVHVHDIFFPREYPESWIRESRFFWNEQYLVQAFLSFNNSFEVLFCTSYVLEKRRPEAARAFSGFDPVSGSSLWLRRREQIA